MALALTHNPHSEENLGNLTQYKLVLQRYLPEGIKTSTMMANILCNKLDRAIQLVSDDCGLSYIRDREKLIFCHQDSNFDLKEVYNRAAEILKDEGFDAEINEAVSDMQEIPTVSWDGLRPDINDN